MLTKSYDKDEQPERCSTIEQTQVRTLGGESQNFTFAPKETLNCSGSAHEISRVDRNPINKQFVNAECSSSSPKRQEQSLEPVDKIPRASLDGACYMSDSEAKMLNHSKSNSKMLHVSSNALPPKFTRKRDSMPDLLPGDDQNIRTFLYAEPIASNQMKTRADLTSLSQHNQLTQ